MRIRKAYLEEIDEIMDVYASARSFMAEHGNPNQWAKRGHPSREFILSHMDKDLYVVKENKIEGVFILQEGIDSTYLSIEGKWINEEKYVTVHALAKHKDAKGIFKIVMDYAKAKCRNVRMDTHKDNLPMQRLALENGFQYCGIIYVSDGTPRLAYQWVEEKKNYLNHKVYIVDYDGTLLSSMSLWRNMCSLFLESKGCILREDVDRITKPFTNRETAEYFVNHYFPNLSVDEMEEEMNSYCMDSYRNQKLKPNALTLLENLKKSGGKLILFSATAMPLLEVSLNTTGISNYFDKIISGSACGLTKKDGSGYLYILEQEGFLKEEALIIEDAPYAVLGAKSVGLTVLGVEDIENQKHLFEVYSNSDFYLRMDE